MKSARKQRQALSVRLFAATVAVFLTCTAAAAAQAPVVDGYGGAGSVVGQVTDSTAAAPTPAPAAAPGAGSGDVVAPPGGGSHAATPATPIAGAQSRGGEPVPTISASGLPFTGLDVALICIGGLVLLCLGLAARWLSTPRSPARRADHALGPWARIAGIVSSRIFRSSHGDQFST